MIYFAVRMIVAVKPASPNPNPTATPVRATMAYAYTARDPPTCSRNPGGIGHFCTKQYWLTIKGSSPGNTIMHEAAQASHQMNKTIPIFRSCSMPSSCAFFRRHVGVCHVAVFKQTWDSLYKSAQVHQHADVATDVQGRSQLQPGSLARAAAPQVERNPVPVFQRPR